MKAYDFVSKEKDYVDEPIPIIKPKDFIFKMMECPTCKKHTIHCLIYFKRIIHTTKNILKKITAVATGVEFKYFCQTCGNDENLKLKKTTIEEWNTDCKNSLCCSN